MNYLIDSYTIYAASVLAANSVLRSAFGAIFPLFTTYMYNDLGIHWASSIPAFLALACVPFPFLFYTYGSRVRKACKYSREAEETMDKVLRQSALPEGAEKALRRVETDRSNLRRERSNTSKVYEEEKLGLDHTDHKDFELKFGTDTAKHEQHNVLPISPVHRTQSREAAGTQQGNMPEGPGSEQV